MNQLRVVSSAGVGLLLFAILPARAVEIRGAGSLPCSQWTIVQKSNDDSLKNSYLAWALGYLSGLAVGTSDDVVRKISTESLIQEIDRRCGVADKELISNVVASIFNALRK